MVTAELLCAIHRVEDLPRLAAALGYEARWRELPSGSLPGEGRPVLIGQLGDFCWYGIPASSPGAVKAARALTARGLPAVVVGLHPGAGWITVACGAARPLDIQLDAPEPLALARLRRAAAIPGEHPLAAAQRIGMLWAAWEWISASSPDSGGYWTRSSPRSRPASPGWTATA